MKKRNALARKDRSELKANEAFIEACTEGPVLDACPHCRTLEMGLEPIPAETDPTEEQ